MPARQRALDARLLRRQPVERGVELALVDRPSPSTWPRLRTRRLGGRARARSPASSPARSAGSTIMARARSRRAVAVRPSRRGQGRCLRSMPSTAATWPCGKARWISKTSSGSAAPPLPPLSRMRRPSISAGGKWPRLASVRFLTLRALAIALAQQDRWRRAAVRDHVDEHGRIESRQSASMQALCMDTCRRSGDSPDRCAAGSSLTNSA